MYRKFPDRRHHRRVVQPGTWRHRRADHDFWRLRPSANGSQIVVVVSEPDQRPPLMQAVIRHEPEELTEWITGRLSATQRLARTVLHRLIVEASPAAATGVSRGQPGRHVADSRAGSTDIRFRHQIGGTDANCVCS